MTANFPPLDITKYWAPLNEQLVTLIDLIPDDKMNWSPKPELHNFTGILIHVCGSRHGWLTYTVKDGEESPDVLREGQTKDGLKEQLRLSWARMERFLSDEEKLSKRYEGDDPVWGHFEFRGQWLAYQQLEHDIHHRADIFHYLALLDIEHGDIQTP